MSLPRPPISANTPIPNEPFSADEVYYLEGNQGRLPLGNGLYIDPATGEFTDVEISLSAITTNASAEPPKSVASESQPSVTIEPVVQAAMEPEFPANPEPDQEFTDPVTHKKYKWKRARNDKGWFIADDPATPENEAWIWQWLPLDNNTGDGQ
jgi:hypothetical protein